MKYDHTVKRDGVLYPAGTEVPADYAEAVEDAGGAGQLTGFDAINVIPQSLPGSADPGKAKRGRKAKEA